MVRAKFEIGFVWPFGVSGPLEHSKVLYYERRLSQMKNCSHYLFPFVSTLGVHERHLDVVPSVGLVVTVPLQPPVHLEVTVMKRFSHFQKFFFSFSEL